MTTAVELQPLNPDSSVQQTIVHDEDPSRGRVKTCWEKTKDDFSFVCNPPPYPPLSNRDVKLHYLRAIGTIAAGLFLESVTTLLLSYPGEDDIAVITIAGGYFSCVSLAVAGVGIREFYKTYKSPRQLTQEQLLLASNA